jgi:hypothetical protein
MSADKKTDRHERAAVAYAHRFVTNAGLIWREITGQDIGIDAIIELPYSDEDKHSVRGFALLQVKSKSDAVIGETLHVTYKKRHHLYWLTQRLPVLLCIVEPADSDQLSTGTMGHWIDYKALKPEDYSILPTTENRWTLGTPLTSDSVWSPSGELHPDWQSEAKAFRAWFEGALVRYAGTIVSTLCEASDAYLGSGKPDQASKCLQQIPLWEEVLLEPETRRSVDMLFAKSIRRLGDIEKQRELARRAEADYGPADFLTYELALTHWTKACTTPFPGRDLENWQKALELIGVPDDPVSSNAKTLKGDLIRLGAYVNIKSTLCCLTNQQRDAPNSELCARLHGVIQHWSENRDALADSEPRYHSQLLNALRALCRGHLSRGEITEAENVLRRLNELMVKEPDREVLALTDFLLLTAWAAVEGGKREAAAAILQCTSCLLSSMGDPLLEWFQEVIRGKSKTIFVESTL